MAIPRSTTSGRPITLTATVKTTGHGGGIPTGNVTFLDGTTILDTASLRHGKASFRVSTLPVGRSAIRAEFDRERR
jgi:prepilin-type processing-associated H-X9-DG protein